MWNVSRPMEHAQVLERGHFLTVEGICVCCDLYLSGGSPLGLLVQGKLGWHCPGKWYQEIESREVYSSAGRWVTHLL